jgi:hypothetical protein
LEASSGYLMRLFLKEGEKEEKRRGEEKRRKKK